MIKLVPRDENWSSVLYRTSYHSETQCNQRSVSVTVNCTLSKPCLENISLRYFNWVMESNLKSSFNLMQWCWHIILYIFLFFSKYETYLRRKWNVLNVVELYDPMFSHLDLFKSLDHNESTDWHSFCETDDFSRLAKRIWRCRIWRRPAWMWLGIGKSWSLWSPYASKCSTGFVFCEGIQKLYSK